MLEIGGQSGAHQSTHREFCNRLHVNLNDLHLSLSGATVDSAAALSSSCPVFGEKLVSSVYPNVCLDIMKISSTRPPLPSSTP